MTATTFDERLERLEQGGRLTASELDELIARPDVLPLGVLADALRRRRHGVRTTFVRVAMLAFDDAGGAIPPAAREVLLTGAPATLDAAVAAVHRAKAAAGDRTVTACSWLDIERLATESAKEIAHVLGRLRGAGLDALAAVPLDAVGDAAAVLEQLASAGFGAVRLTIDQRADQGASLWQHASELQARFGCIRAISPLPSTLRAFRPTTGYEDVRTVALARLAAPDIESIQVDWSRYGPKLAQVALTFGADDVWGVSAEESSAEGRRRAPIPEIRRNIEAAGFEPVERDGRFVPVG